MQGWREYTRAGRSVLAALTAATITGLVGRSLLAPAEPSADGAGPSAVAESTVPIMTLMASSIAETGVSHPITAVLLAFRALDTLLEIAVLLVAGLVGMALRDPDTAPASAVSTPQPQALLAVTSPLLDELVTRLVAVLIVIAAYLLWAGSSMPGGAFQGGALLAASGVLLALLRAELLVLDERFLFRLLMSAGFALFLFVAALGPVTGRPLLYLRGSSAGMIILLVEALLAISIAVVLYSLFANAPSRPVLREA
jgi:multisubunit Na+/H+ antiporter MnhB subunit